MTSSGRVKKQRKTSGVEEVNRKEVIERSGENKYRKEVTEGRECDQNYNNNNK